MNESLNGRNGMPAGIDRQQVAGARVFRETDAVASNTREALDPNTFQEWVDWYRQTQGDQKDDDSGVRNEAEIDTVVEIDLPEVVVEEDVELLDPREAGISAREELTRWEAMVKFREEPLTPAEEEMKAAAWEAVKEEQKSRTEPGPVARRMTDEEFERAKAEKRAAKRK